MSGAGDPSCAGDADASLCVSSSSMKAQGIRNLLRATKRDIQPDSPHFLKFRAVSSQAWHPGCHSPWFFVVQVLTRRTMETRVFGVFSSRFIAYAIGIGTKQGMPRSCAMLRSML